MNNNSIAHGVCTETLPVHVLARLNDLASSVAAAACAPKSELDTTFGRYAPIASIFHSAFLREPGMYKAAVPFLIASRTHLRVLQLPSALPVTARALECVRQGVAEPLSHMALPQDARIVDRYTPDYVVMDDSAGVLFLVHQRRNVRTVHSSIPKLRRTMLAAAMTAAASLGLYGCGASGSCVRLAILDCSDGDSEPENGIYNLSELDLLFGTKGLGSALGYLKQRFRVELERQAGLALQEVLGIKGVPNPVDEAVSWPTGSHFSQHKGQRRGHQEPRISSQPSSLSGALIAFARSAHR